MSKVVARENRIRAVDNAQTPRAALARVRSFPASAHSASSSSLAHEEMALRNNSPKPFARPSSLLVPPHMAKEKKVLTRDTPKYTSSSDEESDDDVDYSDLFKGLDRSKVDKINELIDSLNKKDRLLEKQKIFFMRNMINLLMFENLLL
jgi:hypothetical protein